MYNITWITREILPHEPVVRGWLKRNRISAADEDDLIQEAYARLARVADPAQVASGRAYFFTTVKNLIRERLRRERIVRIDLAEMHLLCIQDDEPSAERHFSARQQLAQVYRFIEELPEPSRSVVKLRKVRALSQRETALALGLTENVVEKQLAAAVRKLLKRMSSNEIAESPPPEHGHRDKSGNKRRDREDGR